MTDVVHAVERPQVVEALVNNIVLAIEDYHLDRVSVISGLKFVADAPPELVEGRLFPEVVHACVAVAREHPKGDLVVAPPQRDRIQQRLPENFGLPPSRRAVQSIAVLAQAISKMPEATRDDVVFALKILDLMPSGREDSIRERLEGLWQRVNEAGLQVAQIGATYDGLTFEERRNEIEARLSLELRADLVKQWGSQLARAVGPPLTSMYDRDESTVSYCEQEIVSLLETFSLDRANIAEGFSTASGFLFEQKQQLLQRVVGDTVGVTDGEGGTARPMVERLLAIYYDYGQPSDLRPLIAIALMVEVLLRTPGATPRDFVIAAIRQGLVLGDGMLIELLARQVLDIKNNFFSGKPVALTLAGRDFMRSILAQVLGRSSSDFRLEQWPPIAQPESQSQQQHPYQQSVSQPPGPSATSPGSQSPNTSGGWSGAQPSGVGPNPGQGPNTGGGWSGAQPSGVEPNPGRGPNSGGGVSDGPLGTAGSATSGPSALGTPSAPIIHSSGGRMNPTAAQEIKRRYGSIPGGVVLEGRASGLDWVTRAGYESNAFVLAGEVVYFAPIPQSSAAVLARALAKDDRVGVSLGETEITYGEIPENSKIAMDLKVADRFLGNIVFASAEMINDYLFANDFRPLCGTCEGNVAVFFKFDDFEFSVADKKLRLSSVRFDARVIPLLDAEADDGGGLPDLTERTTCAEFENNARHVGEFINYYRNEKIVNSALAYGEVAAFLRALKANGIDLDSLARNIERGASLSAARRNGHFWDAWLDYLKDIQTNNQYQHWTAAPYDAAMAKRAVKST